jgi:hypothetical protein
LALVVKRVVQDRAMVKALEVIKVLGQTDKMRLLLLPSDNLGKSAWLLLNKVA